MQTTYGSERWKRPSQPIIMTLGNFDGVHLGHQRIFTSVLTRTKQEKGLSLVYTFEPHPVKVLSPDSPFMLLQTIDQKLATIAAQGINHTIVEPFDVAFAHLHATIFFTRIIIDRIQPQHIFVGYDFTFGAHREGTVHLMYELGLKAGITVTVVPAQFDSETLLSSSVVRQRVRAGDVDGTTKLLGRPHELSGNITAGRGVGRTLGFPTANLTTANECIPANGIYATRFLYDGHTEPAVTYVGTNPTLGSTPLAVETHVLTPVPELLGKPVTVQFLHHIRGEEKFKDTNALKARIAQDCQEAIVYHARHT
jgi:riboflavin kinase/FMN adenylyltransferase